MALKSVPAKIVSDPVACLTSWGAHAACMRSASCFLNAHAGGWLQKQEAVQQNNGTLSFALTKETDITSNALFLHETLSLCLEFISGCPFPKQEQVLLNHSHGVHRSRSASFSVSWAEDMCKLVVLMWDRTSWIYFGSQNLGWFWLQP